MRFKSRRIEREFRALVRQNPSLYALLCWMDGYAQMRWKKEITLTSIKREDDPPSVHNVWRGADARIYHAERDGNEPELTLRDWSELQTVANRKFIYGQTYDGRETKTVHLRVDEVRPMNTHAHVQVPGALWAGQRKAQT